MEQDTQKHFILATVFLLISLLIGTFGYRIIEGWSYTDSFYTTVMILSTVGMGDVNALSYKGKIFTSFLVFLAISLVYYSITILGKFFIEGYYKEILEKKRMEKTIAKMKNHYIVCGAGEVRGTLISSLIDKKIPFIVIENNPEFIESYSKAKIKYIVGDATNDEILLKANIQNARGLISALSSDIDNVYVVLSARNLNPGLNIVTEAKTPGAYKKLKKAGANMVIASNQIVERRMVTALLSPSIITFLDTVIGSNNLELLMDSIEIMEGSKLVGEQIKKAGIREKAGVIIIAIERNNKFIVNPDPNIEFQTGDKMIVLGNNIQIAKLSQLAGDSKRISDNVSYVNQNA
jgi:voltage-gated potassium channel